MKLKLAVGIAVLAILAFTVFGERGLLNLLRYKRQAQALKTKVEQVRRENEALEEEIQRLKSDYAYLERLAREELGMVKPGEIVFQFSGEPPASQAYDTP